MDRIFTTICILFLTVSYVFAQTATVDINVNQATHPVHPTLFGRNNSASDEPSNPLQASDWKYFREAGVRIFRENQGNNTTKYNWRRKLSSHPDWYNNIYSSDWEFEAKSIIDNVPGAQVFYGFQLAGYAAKSDTANFDCWSYDQCSGNDASENWCGAKGSNVCDISRYLEKWNADSTTGIVKHWINDLKLDSTRLKYWNMDNEPEVWCYTHDDVISTSYSAENYLTSYFAVAKKARAMFPGIKLVGPVFTNEWQWYAWNNAKVVGNDGKNYPWVEYFIKRVAEEEKETGIRLLDVLDFHFYPGTDQATTLQLHRIWFDTTWVYNDANGVKLVGKYDWNDEVDKEYIFQRCRQWLTQYIGANHGVSMGLSECGDLYNSDPNVIASFYASTLGVFISEGDVELFTPWTWSTGMWEVLHLFSRYAGSQSFKVTTSNEQNISVYPTFSTLKDTLSLFI